MGRVTRGEQEGSMKARKEKETKEYLANTKS